MKPHPHRAAACALAGVVLWTGLACAVHADDKAAPTGTASGTSTGAAVETRSLSSIAIYPERDASAQVIALNESRISAEIAGRIESISVESGQRIERGAILARIDCRDHELANTRANAALSAARSRLALAEQQLEQARALRARSYVSEEALATRITETRVREAEVAQARAQLATTAHAVSKCVVRAPFRAIVRERLGQVGELAAPGTPIAVLIDSNRIEVVAQVQPRDAASLRAATALHFRGDSGQHELDRIRVSPAIDRQSRTIEAHLRFRGDAAAPGAQGRIVWRDNQAHIPAQYVVRRDGRLGVFVNAGGVARFQPLDHAQEGRPASVDLSATALVVVRGQLTLQDGAPVPAAR